MDKIRKIFADILIRLKNWQILVFGVIGAIILSEIIVAAIHYALWGGRISTEIVFEGFVTPLLDAFIILLFIVAIIARLRDTTRDLNRANQVLEDVTSGIDDSILLVSKDFKILWGNKAALRQTGLTMEELAGNICFKAAHHKDIPCADPEGTCPACEFIHTGGSKTAEHTHCDKDGNKYFREVRAFPIRNAAGELINFVHISRDITARKRLEFELRDFIGRLRNAQEQIGTLSGLLPICSSCKKIRDDKGYWTQLETYISTHTDAVFNHALCPECLKKLYPRYYENIRDKEKDA